MHACKEEETGALASRRAQEFVGWGVAREDQWGRWRVTGKEESDIVAMNFNIPSFEKSRLFFHSDMEQIEP